MNTEGYRFFIFICDNLCLSVDPSTRLAQPIPVFNLPGSQA